MPSCLQLQLQTARAEHFTVGPVKGNTQEINSEPPNIDKHLQSHRTSRASPVAVGTAFLISPITVCCSLSFQNSCLGQSKSSWVTEGWHRNYHYFACRKSLHGTSVYRLDIWCVPNICVLLLVFWIGRWNGEQSELYLMNLWIREPVCGMLFFFFSWEQQRY